MKIVNHMLVATVAVLALGAAVSTRAGEPLLSPKASATQIRVVPGTSSHDPNLLANLPVGNAKGWALAQSRRTVPAVGSNIDLAHAPRPTLSPKDPGYETALRENAVRQVAPLK
jgi:hypothetical protein